MWLLPPLRGSYSAAHSALQIDFRLWLVALVWASHGQPMRLVWMNNTANLGESDPRYRYVPRIRDLSCLCVVRIWAHLGARQGRAGLQAQPRPRVSQQGSQRRRGHALGVTAGSAAYLWLPAPGVTYYSCFD